MNSLIDQLKDVDPAGQYEWSGISINRLNDILRGMWRGENIKATAPLRAKQMGSSGVNLNCDAIPGTATASTIRPFFTIDASAGGANGLISVSAGSVTDLTNSSTVWTGISGNIIYMNDPVDGNVPFAKPLTGPPARQPYLQLSPTATCCYLKATVDATTGFITAMEIDADTGSGLPASTSTNWYYLLSTLAVTITAGKASVKCYNDGAQSSLNFAICNPSVSLPLTDGTSYRVGT